MILGIMDQQHQPERTVNSRRYQRYELETELRAAHSGGNREMRGSSLNSPELRRPLAPGWDVALL